VAAVDFGPAHAITGLALPPSDAPEFGERTPASTRTASVHTPTKSQTPAPEPAVEKTKLIQLAMLAPPATADKPLAAEPPLDIPAPAAPEPVSQPRFNHPTPIPLPESPALEPRSSDPPAAIVPEHEDDDQPIALMTGGYVAMPRTRNARPFQELVPMRGYDVAASGTGVFNHTLTTSGIQSMGSAAGLFFTVHRHSDSRWLDIEAHYGLNQISAHYTPVGSQTSTSASLLSQELTGDVLVRRHLNRARPYQALPYLGLGGGILFFHQSPTGNASFTPTILVDSGIDIPTNNQHIAFRIGSHLLFYPSPNLGTYAVSGWTLSAQPAAGVLFHF
jgi:hypothetical protein